MAVGFSVWRSTAVAGAAGSREVETSRETGGSAFKVALWTWRGPPGHNGQVGAHANALPYIQPPSPDANRGTLTKHERLYLGPGFYAQRTDSMICSQSSSPFGAAFARALACE